jgi:sporulation delaying protein A
VLNRTDSRRFQITGVVKLVFVGLLLASSTLISTVVISALPYNPLSMSMQLEIGVKSIVPEGWGFFTKEPRGLDFYLYRLVGGTWEGLHPLPISAPRNAFGLNRRPRAIPVELVVLLDQLDESQWTKSEVAATQALDQLKDFRVTNAMEHPLLCGKLGVVRREPIPWAWSYAESEVTIPSWIVRLDIECSAQ